MKKILVILGILIGSLGWAQESGTNKAPADKLKVLILNLNNASDTNTYGNSDSLIPVVFNSLYNFIGIIPSLDIPQQSELQKIPWNSTNIAQIAKQQGADLIIYGDYAFSGPAYDPLARLELKIYSTEMVVDILDKGYNTPTDIEIFDTIDRMINDLSVELLKGKVEVAYLNFTGFEIGNEQYDIYVNDKIISTISNTWFDLNLKILANTTYEVEIRRKYDKKIVHDSSFVLQPGVTATISHKARATMDLKALKGKKKGSAYTLFLNGEAIQDDQNYTNLQGGQDYTLHVMEDGTNMTYSNSFYLHDDQRITIKPRIKGGGSPFGLMFSVNDESMIQPAFMWNFHPKMWVAGGLGVSWVPISLLNASDPNDTNAMQIQDPLFMNAYLGYGYYILGERDSEFRVGADLSIHYNFFSSTDIFNQGLPGVNSNPLTVGAFISAEWRFLFVKVGTYFDIMNKRFYYIDMGYPNIVAGVKFPLGGGEYNSLNLSKKGKGTTGTWGVQLGINDESMLLAGAHWSVNPKLWMSSGLTSSYWPGGVFGMPADQSAFFLSAYYSIGYHILGSLEQDFRLGGEVAVKDLFVDALPQDFKQQSVQSLNSNPLTIGPFVRAEWKFIYAKVGYYFDILNNPMVHVWYPVVSAGVVLRFQ